jgi:hypothetical protein
MSTIWLIIVYLVRLGSYYFCTIDSNILFKSTATSRGAAVQLLLDAHESKFTTAPDVSTQYNSGACAAVRCPYACVI